MLRARKNRQPTGTQASKSVVLCLALACILACTGRRSPQAAYDQAQTTFQHGDLKRAQEEAKKGYDDFHAIDAEWAWKFRILQSNALISQGKGGEVLVLLASDPMTPPSSELIVQKQRLE